MQQPLDAMLTADFMTNDAIQAFRAALTSTEPLPYGVRYRIRRKLMAAGHACRGCGVLLPNTNDSDAPTICEWCHAKS